MNTSGIEILTTGIGSLPMNDVNEAITHVTSQYDIPFFPQLLSSWNGKASPMTPAMLLELIPIELHDLLNQSGGTELLARLSAKSLDEAAAHLESLPGFTAFARATSARPRIKFQLAGPCLMIELLRPMVPGFAETKLREISWHWLELLTRAACVRLLTPIVEELILLWDDSLLVAAAGSERERFRRLCKSPPKGRLKLGLHCCAPLRLDALLTLGVETVLAIDTNVVDCESESARQLLERHLGDGGTILFGVVDTRDAALDERALEAKIGHVLRSTSRAGRTEVIVTGGCGTGLHELSYERDMAALLRRIARRPRSKLAAPCP